MSLPFGPPRPPRPWQPWQNVPYTPFPRSASPVDFAAYEGGFAPSRIPNRLQRDRISRIITSICASVSMPPALCAKAGIAVPRTPLTVTLRIAASSTSARYTGSPTAIAAPPRPSCPWHPAQLLEKSALKSSTALGATVSDPWRGWPRGVPQPLTSATQLATAASARRWRAYLIAAPRGLHHVESSQEPQSPRAT